MLTIRPNVALGAQVLSVETDSTDFAVELMPLEEGGDAREVVVAPLTTDAARRGVIKVVVAVANSEPKTIFAHALVR